MIGHHDWRERARRRSLTYASGEDISRIDRRFPEVFIYSKFLTPICYQAGDLAPIEEVSDWTGREIELDRLRQVGHEKCSLFALGEADLLEMVLRKFREKRAGLAKAIDLVVAVFPVSQLQLGGSFAKFGSNKLPFLEVLWGSALELFWQSKSPRFGWQADDTTTCSS